MDKSGIIRSWGPNEMAPRRCYIVRCHQSAWWARCRTETEVASVILELRKMGATGIEFVHDASICDLDHEKTRVGRENA